MQATRRQTSCQTWCQTRCQTRRQTQWSPRCFEREVVAEVAETGHRVGVVVAARQERRDVDPDRRGRFDLGLRRRRGRAETAHRRALDRLESRILERTRVREDIEDRVSLLLVHLPGYRTQAQQLD